MSTEELKKHREQFRPLLEGWLEGREIEMQHEPSNMWLKYSLFGLLNSSSFRIKPEPQYRPWTLEEVPVGAVIVSKEHKDKMLITSAGATGVLFGGNNMCSYQHLLDIFTLQDGSPCGVLV